MSTLHETFLTHMNWRYAVKKFDPTQKISDKDWQVLEESLSLSPSSYGLQPFQFLIVQNAELRKKLTPVSYGQQQIENCSHLVVLTYLKTVSENYISTFIQNVAKTRGIPESGLEAYKQVMIGDVVRGPRSAQISTWSSRQTYIAMGGFMTAAALLNVDTCPMEGIDTAQYDEILSLKNTDYATVAVIAAGYRAKDDGYQHAKKVRMDKNNLIKILK